MCGDAAKHAQRRQRCAPHPNRRTTQPALRQSSAGAGSADRKRPSRRMGRGWPAKGSQNGFPKASVVVGVAPLDEGIDVSAGHVVLAHDGHELGALVLLVGRGLHVRLVGLSLDLLEQLLRRLNRAKQTTSTTTVACSCSRPPKCGKVARAPSRRHAKSTAPQVVPGNARGRPCSSWPIRQNPSEASLLSVAASIGSPRKTHAQQLLLFLVEVRSLREKPPAGQGRRCSRALDALRPDNRCEAREAALTSMARSRSDMLTMQRTGAAPTRARVAVAAREATRAERARAISLRSEGLAGA